MSWDWIKKCRFRSFRSSTDLTQYFGALITPKRRLIMWVGPLRLDRKQTFYDARRHIADNNWKLIAERARK